MANETKPFFLHRIVSSAGTENGSYVPRFPTEEDPAKTFIDSPGISYAAAETQTKRKVGKGLLEFWDEGRTIAMIENTEAQIDG